MRLNLKWKIMILAALAVLLPMAVILVITGEFEKNIESTATSELNTLARLNVAQIARDVHGLCGTSNDLLQQRLDHGLDVSISQVRAIGRPRLHPANTLIWNCVNQYTHNADTLRLPQMFINGKPVDKVGGFDRSALVVDRVTELTGATCTIFQRMNERGDMLRIATTVKNAKGNRAIGTYIPAVNPDGRPNPVVSALLEGKTFRGAAYVVNNRYLTAYRPLLDEKGSIIGAIYVGLPLESVESLRKTILNTKVGKTGYVYVLGASNEHPGHYIISKDGLRDGEDIYDATDADGNYFIRELITETQKASAGEVIFHTYKWKNPGEDTAREKLVAAVYFAPWDWVIGAGVYKEDYLETSAHLSDAIDDMRSGQIYIYIIIAIIALIVAFVVARRMAGPLEYVAGLARGIADGDIAAAGESLENSKYSRRNTRDETGELIESFKKMTANLSSLLKEVRHSGIQVTTSATEISASARQLEAAVAQQASSTRQVNSAGQNISRKSDELVGAVHEVAGEVDESAALAESGGASLSEMKEAIDHLSSATASITSKLSVVSEKANKISAVVTTINKISDRTNLLSLNAAIEAEKAGEYGRGFSVVAREISRLADQTAIATRDIEQMVRDMQRSVSSGVMEMDKFGEEVRQGVGKVSTIGSQLNMITERVRSIGPRFDELESGMETQAEGAGQISEAMSQLAESTGQTRESLAEFKKVTQQLNEAVEILRNEVSKFKIN
ncbi:MAG: Cache 3/Cache 2 fusion domain-containing protein [Candidatus Kapaibacterium sp.]